MYKGFARDLLDFIKCPYDGDDLAVVPGHLDDDFIENSKVMCLDCGREYCIENGILNMIDTCNDSAPEMETEIIARDEYASGYDKFMDDDWFRMEIPTTMKHISCLDGKHVVEFGSGTGRFSGPISSQANLFLGIDFSLESLRLSTRRFADNKKAGLVLADITKIRLRPGSFDLALSCQVIEHIPSRTLRNKFIRLASECLKADGCFVCTAYYHDLRRRMRFCPRDGFHRSGIYYHYFDKKELREDFSRKFEIDELHPFLFHVPLIWKGEFKYNWLSTIFERTPILKEFGSLILVKGRRKANYTQLANTKEEKDAARVSL